MGFDHSGQISGKKRPFILDQKRKHWASSWISDLVESEESRGIDPEESDMAVQMGDMIMIGRDSFLCGKEEIDIPGSLLEFLHRKGIFFWDGLINKWNGPFPIWYEASCLNMQSDIALSWDHIKTKLRNGGFFRSSDHDFLTWRISDRMDSICVKDIYRLLLSEGRQLCNNAFPGIFWKSGCQSKMVFFA